MLTHEEYKTILTSTIKNVEERFPNWNLLDSKEKFASVFARCMPNNLTYEDISIVCFMFHEREKLK